MPQLEKKIINFLYNLTQGKRVRNILKQFNIENPVEIIHAYNRLHGFDLGPRDLAMDNAPDSGENADVIGRIMAAYARSKQEQPSEGPYAISGLWYDTLEQHYGHLAGVEADSGGAARLQAFLGNFFRAGTYGLSASGAFPNLADPASVERYLNTYAYTMLNLALYLQLPGVRKNLDSEYFLFDGKTDPSALWREICERAGVGPEYPQVGNVFGLRMDTGAGTVTLPLAAYRHLYIAMQVMGLCAGAEAPRIMEIGGGFGGVQYYLQKLGGNRCIIWSMDIPEINIISSYFLINALPGVDVVLYGEQAPEPRAGRGTIHIMPNWAIRNFAHGPVHVTVNADSLPEMPLETVREYLGKVARYSGCVYSYNQDCGTHRQTRLSQLDTAALGLTCVSYHPAWLGHGYFERVYEPARR